MGCNPTVDSGRDFPKTDPAPPSRRWSHYKKKAVVKRPSGTKLTARCSQVLMIFRPAGRFLTIPFPPGPFAARFLAAVILPPLLFFAISNSFFWLLPVGVYRDETGCAHGLALVYGVKPYRGCRATVARSAPVIFKRLAKEKAPPDFPAVRLRKQRLSIRSASPPVPGRNSLFRP